MFRFYLNDTLVSDPINWADFTETIERQADIKGLLPKYELQMSFTSSGYQLLSELKQSEGFCTLVNLRVEQACDGDNWSTILKGYIIISRCIFHLNKCIVDCDVVDDNYGALIFNNKSIKTSLASDKSKMGINITPATSSLLRLFNPATGTYTIPADARESYNVYEAFKYLISFMTDGKVGFESDFLTTYGVQLYLLTGKKLRTNDSGNYPIISFTDLFQEVNKKFNIGFTVIQSGGIPTIKIENIEYFYSSNDVLTLQDISDLQESFNPELLYSGVKLGGTTAIYDPTIHSIVPRQFQGFLLEEYFFQNQCNLDSQLDLSATYIFDTNIIEELAYTNQTNENYDENIFVIDGQLVGLDLYATQTLVTGVSPAYTYNSFLTNEYASRRFQFFGNTALYEGLNTSGFLAERTNYDDTGNLATAINGWNNPDFYQGDLFGLPACALQTSAVLTTIFDDDSTAPNYDSGGNYDNVTGKYTAPIEGSYFFEYNAHFKILADPPFTIRNRACRFTVYLRRYNSLNVLQEEFTEVTPSASTYADLPAGIYIRTIKEYFYCAVGDYVIAAARLESVCANPLLNNSALYVNVTNGSTFTALGTASGGGVFQEGANDATFISKLQFTYPVSRESYDLIKSDLTKGILAGIDGNTTKRGWLRKTERNLSTGFMKIELISNKLNT